jgi:hypothetical protein
MQKLKKLISQKLREDELLPTGWEEKGFEEKETTVSGYRGVASM